MIDRIRVMFGGLTAETRVQVPSRCWRCPVLNWTEDEIAEATTWKKRFADEALEALDDAEDNPAQPPQRLEQLAERATDATQRYCGEDDNSEQLMKTRERLIEASGGCILGAVLGDQTETNAAMRVLSAIQPWLGLPLQRSCTNPAFEGLQDDPFVATALQIGHWVGRTQ